MRRSHGRARRVTLLALVGTALVLLLPWAAGPGAAAVQCDKTWNGGNGDFKDGGKWTPAGAPGLTDSVCIKAPGVYTVTLRDPGGAVIEGLTIGGALGRQTLRIEGTAASPTLSLDRQGLESDGILATGELELTSTGTGRAALVIVGDSLTNNGRIEVFGGTGANHRLDGDLVNNGTVALYRALLASDATWTNTGTIDIASGASLELSATWFTQTEGAIVNGGSFEQTHGNFTYSGGTASGNPLELLEPGSISPSGGSASLLLHGEDASLSSDIGAGITLTVEGEVELELFGDRTNDGTVVLRNTESGDTRVETNARTLTNEGTIRSKAGGGSGENVLTGALINNGLLDVEHSLHDDGRWEGDWTNNGTIEIAAGETLSRDAVGATVNDGLVDVGPGASLELAGVLANQSGSTLSGGGYRIAGTLRYRDADVDVLAAELVLDGPASAIQDLTGVDALCALGTITEAGSLELASARDLVVANALASFGDLVVGAGSTVDPTSLTLEGGTLSGSGTVAAAVTNKAATIRPGGSPGTLTVDDAFTQRKKGRLELELDGTGAGEYDLLAIAGKATLGGELVLDTNYTPAFGDTFTVLTYGSKAKEYDSVEGQFLSDPVDAAWDVATRSRGIELELVETADLRTTQRDSTDPVPAGVGFSYTIEVENRSSRAATEAKLTDTIKAPLTLDGTPTTSKGSCSVGGTKPKVTCELGTLDPGETVTVTIPVRGTQAGSAKNKATASSGTLDSAPGNDDDTEKTTIT